MSSAFEPFRYRAFAVIWSANFISLLGTWMNEVGAGWLMATLSPSPGWVAMVQTATYLPVLLLALPAGALADLVDRRRLIIAGQSAMAIGAGAVGGALLLPKIRPRIGTNGVIDAAGLVLALALAAFALVPVTVVAVCSSLAFGAAWVLSLSLLNASAQLVLPDWVRARGMSILLSVFFGALALGSAFWGQVADLTGIRVCLLISAVGSLLALPVVRRFRVAERAVADVAPVGPPVPVEPSVPR